MQDIRWFNRYVKGEIYRTLIKTVFEQEVTAYTLSHNDGFAFTFDPVKVETPEGIVFQFTLGTQFLRRALGATGMETWNPPNVGVAMGCESYCRVDVYNYPIAFQYETEFYGYICTSSFSTDYNTLFSPSLHTVTQSRFETNNDAGYSELQKLGIQGGKQFPAIMRLRFNYETLNDVHPFISDTTLGAKFAQLELHKGDWV